MFTFPKVFKYKFKNPQLLLLTLVKINDNNMKIYSTAWTIDTC